MARIAGVNLPNQKRARDRADLHLRHRPARPRRRSAPSTGLSSDEKIKRPDRRGGHEASRVHRRESSGRGRPAPRAHAGDQAPDARSAAYRGIRHRRGLPVRGQRTKTNARTQGSEEDRSAAARRRPRRPDGTSSQTARPVVAARRRVKKNIAIGQAHIKTSFNNTIVSLTDSEGNVIAWESAGSAGFKGSRKSTPFAAQVTADAVRPQGHGARPAEGRGLRQGPRLGPRDRDPFAPGRRPRDPRRQGRHPAGPQRRAPEEAAEASNGPRSLAASAGSAAARA